jgi:para-aminobenzoate synthetase component I
VPRYVFIGYQKKIRIEFTHDSNIEEIETLFREIISVKTLHTENIRKPYQLSKRMNKTEYLGAVGKIQQHILKGDIYEMNFCQEFYIENAMANPVALYQKLNSISPAPFSAYFRYGHKYLICSSPERFLAKRGEKIISQPIKGTIKRGENEDEDNKLKYNLFNNEKERAENVMIVDLVRNDLSRTAKKGSVVVEELCKIYSYKQVHQMVSTICSEIDATRYDITDLIKFAFPMGSMTGAPKIKAMELIEKYEKTKRGLYSGSIGYIAPNKDFDFNVVIRSILYNSENKYLSFIVGSAITSLSNPESEYDECLLKASGILKALDFQDTLFSE